jgi:hypothetical protein
MQEYQEEADLNDRIALSGVDPRGYSSRALKALNKLLNPSVAQVFTGGSNAAREQGGQNIMENIGTLLDPTAWMPTNEFTADVGAAGGEFHGFGQYEQGKMYADSKGNIWRYRNILPGKGEANLGIDSNVVATRRKNVFDFVGTTQMQKEADEFYKTRGKTTRDIYKK